MVSHDDPKKMDEFLKIVEKSRKKIREWRTTFAHFYPEPNYEEEEVEDAFPRPNKKSVMPTGGTGGRQLGHKMERKGSWVYDVKLDGEIRGIS